MRIIQIYICFWNVQTHCAVELFPHTSIFRIKVKTFRAIVGARFKASVQEVVSSLIKSALSVHFAVVGNFRKTAANFHYEFNIRHLSGVFSGLLQASPKDFSEPEKLVMERRLRPVFINCSD